jgi:hypothetical protein
MRPDLQKFDDPEKTLYHFSFLKDIKVHGIYFNNLKKFLSLYCFIRKEHAHDFYSVILFSGGKGNIIISNERFEIKPQTISLIAPLQMHSFEEIDDAD